MKMKFLALFFLLCLSTSYLAQMTQLEADSMCNISAYIIDKDPKGLNVREKPNGRSKVIGKIPFNTDGTVVDVIAAEGRWVKINNAKNVDDETVFSKTGWVYAPLLAVSTKKKDGDGETVNAYEMPSMGNAVIAKLPAYEEFKLETCFESWVKIVIPKKKGSIFGWLPLENQCVLAWTNCS
ncbi:MAG: SH3 domain-containing protein [Acidobacteria bacterium]|nr:SH3 domain-containing protein [Acidobacteriota bacterium]